MKKDIHPAYHHDTVVTCSCGNTFKTGSTVKEIQTELCSKCHPFYTGQQKLVDTAGRVESFRARLDKAKKRKEETAQQKMKKEMHVIEIEGGLTESAPASDTAPASPVAKKAAPAKAAKKPAAKKPAKKK